MTTLFTNEIVLNRVKYVFSIDRGKDSIDPRMRVQAREIEKSLIGTNKPCSLTPDNQQPPGRFHDVMTLTGVLSTPTPSPPEAKERTSPSVPGTPPTTTG